MFFIEKTAPDAPEQFKTLIKTNKPASRVRLSREPLSLRPVANVSDAR